MHIRWLLVGAMLFATACNSSTTPAVPTASRPASTSAPAAAQTTEPTAPSVSISGPLADESKSLNGAGATFPAPLYQKWFDEYAKVTQVQVNYQAIGSGGGIKGVQDQ